MKTILSAMMIVLLASPAFAECSANRLSVSFGREAWEVQAGQPTNYYVGVSVSADERSCPARDVSGTVTFSDGSTSGSWGPVDVGVGGSEIIVLEHLVPDTTCGQFTASFQYSGQVYSDEDGHTVGGASGTVDLDNFAVCNGAPTTTTITTTTTLPPDNGPGKNGKGHAYGHDKQGD